MDNGLDNYVDNMTSILKEMGSVLIAFSGGIDSTLLAVMAHKILGDSALAITACSPALASRELDEANLLAGEFGFQHRVIKTYEMEKEGYLSNPSDRCYFCKTELYDQLVSLAESEGYAYVANGANVDDQGDYRPGMKAAKEHLVRSPMVEAGLNKDMVRRIARELNIRIWDKPAQPCLSSRIPYGIRVTTGTLSKIEQAEEYLRSLGLREVRARHHDKLCRVEVGAGEMDQAFAHRREIVDHLKKIGYLWVSLDLSGLRSGSLNDGLNLLSDGRK